MSKIEIEDVQRLDVKPGDVLLVSVPPGTTAQDAAHVKNAFETTLPIRVVVKTSDIQAEVVTGAVQAE